MINIIESVISEFRSCFSRKAAFSWFSIVIFGLIIRFDHHGISSIIRWLMLYPACYDPMPRFFRASSRDSEELMSRWTRTAVSRYPLIKFNGHPLLIGDGIKIPKESSKMPGVKFLHQDSENSGKGDNINGHHFGYAGLLVGCSEKAFCLPLHGQIHEGVGAKRHDIKIGGEPTIVTRMANLVIRTAEQTEYPCYVTKVYHSFYSCYLLSVSYKTLFDHMLCNLLNIKYLFPVSVFLYFFLLFRSHILYIIIEVYTEISTEKKRR
ncbi:Transposase DDE domain-containing protein [Desulfonema magnum]|uniref:Transposase DDE domain-containing protein n=1 Tax=Desulfonema magnum TaxID=45655 RepID=A0A975C1C8_9BACT|nr:Transposase DDE domain-containing protein [Desulfonema magnum]